MIGSGMGGMGKGGGMGDERVLGANVKGARIVEHIQTMIKLQVGISLARVAQEMTNRSFDNSQVAIVRAAMEAESFRLDQEIKEGRG